MPHWIINPLRLYEEVRQKAVEDAHKQSHYARTLADHPDVIDEVIQEAGENKVNQLKNNKF